jgi:hypothetical protein
MNRKIARFFILAVSFALLLDACSKTEDPINTSDREKFLGYWYCTSACTQNPSSSFNMNITAGNSSPDQIVMENFDGRGVKVIGYVSGSSFSIPGAPTNVFSGDTISGSGSYNSSTSKISISFTVRDGQTVDQCSASGHK